MAKVQRLVSAPLNGKQLNKVINPDEATAYGFVGHATILFDKTMSKSTNETILPDIELIFVDVKTARNNSSRFSTATPQAPPRTLGSNQSIFCPFSSSEF